MGANGLGESDDKAEEDFAGIGVLEAVDIFGGLDFFGWGLEMVRRGDEWDLLGMWDRGEDYGLLGVAAWGEVDCRSANWAVVWRWGGVGPCGWWCVAGWGAAIAAGWGGGGGGGGWGFEG